MPVFSNVLNGSPSMVHTWRMHSFSASASSSRTIEIFCFYCPSLSTSSSRLRFLTIHYTGFAACRFLTFFCASAYSVWWHVRICFRSWDMLSQVLKQVFSFQVAM